MSTVRLPERSGGAPGPMGSADRSNGTDRPHPADRTLIDITPMPRKSVMEDPLPRKRRTADEARTAMLDAAEQRLVASGPAAIRLQEVAADVGVSHPTVLHHFGNR